MIKPKLGTDLELKLISRVADEINVVIEIPKDSDLDYEMDPENREISVESYFLQCVIPLITVLYPK
jgi:hypothetical protein